MEQPSGRKIKSTCKHMAKCGLTSLSRCKLRKAGLPECEGCKLVTRASDRWKMIDRKPYRKCRRCGEFRPLSMFYPKKIKKPDGRIYETNESMCKLCRSEKYLKERKEKIWK